MKNLDKLEEAIWGIEGEYRDSLTHLELHSSNKFLNETIKELHSFSFTHDVLSSDQCGGFTIKFKAYEIKFVINPNLIGDLFKLIPLEEISFLQFNGSYTPDLLDFQADFRKYSNPHEKDVRVRKLDQFRHCSNRKEMERYRLLYISRDLIFRLVESRKGFHFFFHESEMYKYIFCDGVEGHSIDRACNLALKRINNNLQDLKYKYSKL